MCQNQKLSRQAQEMIQKLNLALKKEEGDILSDLVFDC